MITTSRILSLALSLLLLEASSGGHAQVTGASLSGQITDTTGAAIPAAALKLTNEATNLTAPATSSDQGTYRLAPLPPGTYTLKVEAKGFAAYVQRGIVLTVGLSANQNVTLKAGTTEETVQVTADAELINTTSPSIGLAVNQEEVTQLPLNGRDPQNLVFLAPGVTNGVQFGVAVNQGGFTFPEETGGSSGVGAGRADSTYYLLDGVPNSDNYVGLAAPFPNADATQEFRVVTNNFNAQYGFAPGAVVLIESKSGANELHGGAWDFLRNQSFNASDWFSHKVNPLHQNQFGADIGGPIIRNTLFFFTNYQGTRASAASTSAQAYTYTAAMLQGDFSGLPVTLNAPFQTVNGVRNQINPSALNQTAVQIAQLAMPISTNPNGFLYYTTPKQSTSYDEGTGRIDYNISARQRLFARAYINYFNQPSVGNKGNIASYSDSNPLEDYNGILSHTWTINPKLVNVVAIFNTQIDTKQAAQALMSNGKPFCWSAFINTADPSGACSTEGFNISGDFYGPWIEPCGVNRGTYGLYDNFAAEEGRHSFTFGINAQHQHSSEACDYPMLPIMGFNGQYTNWAMADFLMGDLQALFQGAGEVGIMTEWQMGYYAEDQFRLKPNLTLQAGLRWDPNYPMQIASGRAATFVPGQQSTVFPNAPTGLVFPGDSGIGAGLMRTTYGYWQPRVGFAWQPHALPRTSFHAGFGMFTAPLITSNYNHVFDNSPFAPTFSLNGTATTPLSLNDPWAGFAGTGGKSPFPPFATAAYRPPASATFTPGLAIPATYDVGFKNGITQAWNVTGEHQYGAGTLVRLAYVGSESFHQVVTFDKNPGIYSAGGTRSTYPAFGTILQNFSNGTASYNGLEATVERHLSRGLQFQSNFTWSKLIDTASEGNISFYGALPDPFNLRFNRGISNANFPFIWVSSAIYRAPLLTNHNQFARQIAGGWEISAIVTSQSGRGFTVNGGFGNNNSDSLQNEDRADRVPGQPLNVRQGGKSQWIHQYFNINAFTVNPPGTFGDTGKNIMRGPAYNNIDAGLFKNWKIRERYNVQFRWEMYNALNHPNFSTPNATNQIAPGGVNVGGTEGAITSMFGSPRIMQGALKFTF